MNTPTPPPGPGIVVLLVDDQPIVAEAVRRCLAPLPDMAFHYCRDPQQAVMTRLRELMPRYPGSDLRTTACERAT